MLDDAVKRPQVEAAGGKVRCLYGSDKPQLPQLAVRSCFTLRAGMIEQRRSTPANHSACSWLPVLANDSAAFNPWNKRGRKLTNRTGGGGLHPGRERAFAANCRKC